MNNRTTSRLRFETENKAPSKLIHLAKELPGDALRSQLHQEVEKEGQDNVGLEAANTLGQSAETGGRLIQEVRHSRKLRSHRASTQKRTVSPETPEQKNAFGNAHSRQKQNIKKQYAGKSTSDPKDKAKAAETAAKAARSAAEKVKEAWQYVMQHKKGFAIAGAFVLVLAFCLNILSSCSVLVEGIGAGLVASVYPALDEDMADAEAAYCAMEAELEAYLDDYEDTHTYSNYSYDLDAIGHDPYVLISILSSLYPNGWTLADIEPTLQALFEKQYILTETVDAYGKCTVTLENFDLSHVPAYILSEEELSRYATYMATLGNRPDLFPNSEYIGRYDPDSYFVYDIPPEALEDERFAAMIEEGEKHLGSPYVWGGGTPETSFDCSGFVSWVLNHSGWSVGRLSAQGLFNICTPVSPENAKPGDLIFFKGTYETTEVSHVGIYAGGGQMLHCGDPISYTSVQSPYWQSHFYCYGRLP